APVDDRMLLLDRLKQKKVHLRLHTKLATVGTNTVTIEDQKGSSTLAADTVVLCLGSYPNDGLANELKKQVKRVMIVGDALQPRRVTEAMAEGALAALAL